MPQLKRIILLLENESGTERNLSLGISKYARDAKKNWHLIPVAGNTPEKFRALIDWNIDGIIGYATTQKAVDAAAELPAPFINLCTHRLFKNCIQVGPDNRALGRIAADHLIAHGFQNLTFVTRNTPGFHDLRLEGFRERTTEQNLPLQTIQLTHRPLEDPALLRELKNTKNQTAFCCSNDNLSRGVLRACREQGHSVPDPIAILGINNNPLLCETGLIPLSSVDWSAQQVGIEAARILDTQLNNPTPPAAPVLILPTEVVTRQSTDIYAIDDKLVTQTLQLIHEQAKHRIQVKDLVSQSGTSRRNLETRFQLAIKRSLHDEIRRVQIDLAKKALRETNAPMDSIADASGFGSGIHLSIEFKKSTGITPRAYRKQFNTGRHPGK